MPEFPVGDLTEVDDECILPELDAREDLAEVEIVLLGPFVETEAGVEMEPEEPPSLALVLVDNKLLDNLGPDKDLELNLEVDAIACVDVPENTPLEDVALPSANVKDVDLIEPVEGVTTVKDEM